MNQESVYCKTPEASEILGLDVRALRKLVDKCPNFPGAKIGKRYYFIKDELVSWAKENRNCVPLTEENTSTVEA